MFSIKFENLSIRVLFTCVLLFSLAVYCPGQENSSSVDDKTSLFDYIYHLEGTPKITINSDIKRLINKSSREEYQKSGISLRDQDDQLIFDVTGRVRSRGNMRKQVCRIPPIKFDFSKPLLDSLGFIKKIDKLKFVFPCSQNTSAQEKLFKEFFLYDLYHLIDSSSMRAKLVEANFVDGKDVKNQFIGFIIEDEEEYSRRMNARLVEIGIIKADAMSRKHFMRMTFFQYMIANVDWSVEHKHNLEIAKLPGIPRVIAIPYDFDYSGFVGQPYAIPHESLPIKTVAERYYHPYKVSENEFNYAIEFFRGIEEDVYALCDSAIYMQEKTIKNNKRFLENFFDLLRKPNRIKKSIVRQ